MSVDDNITVIVINYCTPHLLPVVTDSFKQFYPTVYLILVDNGSKDGSRSEITRLQEQHKAVGSIFINHNIYHGPAVNLALRKTSTPYFFLLDSDCKVKKGGFLEKMSEHFHDDRVYAVGKVRYVQPTGVPVLPVQANRREGIPYAETWGALFHRERTAHLGEFARGGASGNRIAAAAYRQHYRVVHFHVEEFIDHLGAGTRRMFNMSALPHHRQKPSKWSKGKRRF